MKALLGAIALALSLAAPAAATALERPDTWKLPAKVAGSIPVGRQPVDLAFAPSGEAWVANWGDGTVSRLAPDGRCVGTYKVGAKPRKLAIDSHGNVWVYCWGPNLLFKLSSEGKQLNRVMIGKECRDMIIDAADHVWLASTNSNHVYQIQPNGQAATWFEVPSPACLVLDDDARLWVGTMEPGGTTNLFAFRQDGMEGYILPGVPSHLALSQGGAIVVSYADQPRRLSRLAADRRRLDDLWTGFPAADFQSEAGAMWVTNSTYEQQGAELPTLTSPIANTISRLSPGGRVLATYSAGSDAWQVKKAPNGELWVVNFLGNRVTRLKP